MATNNATSAVSLTSDEQISELREYQAFSNYPLEALNLFFQLMNTFQTFTDDVISALQRRVPGVTGLGLSAFNPTPPPIHPNKPPVATSTENPVSPPPKADSTALNAGPALSATPKTAPTSWTLTSRLPLPSAES